LRVWTPALLFLVAGCSEPTFRAQVPPPAVGAPTLSERVHEDRFIQDEPPAVDVLFVIDQSGSMGDEQTALRAAIPTFSSYFVDRGVQFRVAGIRVDTDRPEAGHLARLGDRAYIDNASEDPPAEIVQLLLAIEGNSLHEKGLPSTRLALSEDLADQNQLFLRPHADLEVVLVSDEPDQSTMPADSFLAWWRGLKSGERTARFSAVVGLPPEGCGDERNAAAPAPKYVEVALETGGLVRSICDDDWVSVLDDLGLRLARSGREFFLSREPFEESIDVRVRMKDPDSSNQTHSEIVLFVDAEDEERRFIYDAGRNSVTLPFFTPPNAAEVFVRYLPAADNAEPELPIEVPEESDSGLP